MSICGKMKQRARRPRARGAPGDIGFGEKTIRRVKDSPFALTASLRTADVARAVRVGDAIETGTVRMNRADYPDPGLCWTGGQQTGRGGALPITGHHNLTRPKSCHIEKVTS